MRATYVHNPSNAEYLAMSGERLRDLYPIGGSVTTLVSDVSSDGMNRTVTILAVRNGEICNVSNDVARVLGRKVKDGGIRVGGCGMDMGFAIVYELGRCLYGNSVGRVDSPLVHNSDAGYALTHRNL